MAFHEYPYTDFHEMNLDWVIKKVKELATAWAQVQQDWTDEQAAFANLQSWIENYFNNLNVQTEINVKLDAMVEAGTMSELIAPFVASGLPAVVADQIGAVVASQIGPVVAAQIGAVVADQLPAVAAAAAASEVSAWLAAHVNPETGYVIDDSFTVQGAAADAKAVGDEFTAINSALNDLDKMVYQQGYFPNAYKAIDSVVGIRTFKFDANKNVFDFSYKETSSGTKTASINLMDSGLTVETGIVSIDDYSAFKLTVETNIPQDAHLIARVFLYGDDGITNTHNYSIPLTDGTDIMENVKEYAISKGWTNDKYYMIRNITSDSYAYTEIPYIGASLYGFFTAEQAENYSINTAVENLQEQLQEVKLVTDVAVTKIGELNLFDETKIRAGELTTSGDVSTPSVTSQQITSDFIKVSPNVEYVFQAWADQLAASDFLIRICTYDNNKSFISRSDTRTYQSIIDGFIYNRLILSYDNNISFIRISISTYGNYKIKLERGNATTDWTFGIGAIKNNQAWNSAVEKPIYGIIHRGCGENQIAPENTIPGFIWGKKNGFDFAETDIRYTSDGVAVLLHDASINRTARNADGSDIVGTVNIADITYQQALTYDFGIYKGVEYAGTKIPTVEELIVLAKNIGLHIFLELKAFNNANTDIPNLVDMLNGYRMLSHVSWIASNYDWLATLKNYDVSAHLCILTTDVSAERDMIILSMLKTPSNEVTLSILTDFITSERIANMKARGISCNAYCPNTVENMLAVDDFVTCVTSDKLNYETVRKNSILGN